MNGFFRSLIHGVKRNSIEPNSQKDYLEPIGDSFWYEYPNYWEPNVIIAIRDVLRSGSACWDIGANVGGITRLASRIVGPAGKVIAVEASLENYRKLNRNIAANCLYNVFGIRGAVWNKSGNMLNLYHGDGGNDSLIENSSLVNGTEVVTTITLDDLYRHYGMPDLIKLDIEGVEFEALQGAQEILGKMEHIKRPIIVLEQGNNNMSALDLLLTNKYVIQDLSTGLMHSKVPLDYQESISNWIAVPHELEYQFQNILAPFEEKFTECNQQSGFLIENLAKGRYKVEIELEPYQSENVYVCVWKDSTIISRYHGKASWLNRSYKSRQIDFVSPGLFRVTIENPGGSTPTKSTLKTVRLYSKNFLLDNTFSYQIAP